MSPASSNGKGLGFPPVSAQLHNTTFACIAQNIPPSLLEVRQPQKGNILALAFAGNLSWCDKSSSTSRVPRGSSEIKSPQTRLMMSLS